MGHCCDDLIALFRRCFFRNFTTCLVKGSDEPVYLPASYGRPHHEIRFAHDYFSSALHECCHWFIAGAARRQLEDFGYWYQPDGRSPQQQAAFEQVEVKPQALEWILSVAAGHRFRISADNLSGVATDMAPFRAAVLEQVHHYIANGLPTRAEKFRLALADFYRTGDSMDRKWFVLTDL